MAQRQSQGQKQKQKQRQRQGQEAGAGGRGRGRGRGRKQGQGRCVWHAQGTCFRSASASSNRPTLLRATPRRYNAFSSVGGLNVERVGAGYNDVLVSLEL